MSIPAFPNEFDHENGMRLIDYFAAKALQGLLASYGQHELNSYRDFAIDAYAIADAMIEQQGKH